MGILFLTLGLLVHISMSNPPCNDDITNCPAVPYDWCPSIRYKQLVCCFGQCDCCTNGKCCDYPGCAGEQGLCYNPYEGGCDGYGDCRHGNGTTRV
ncbi:unnamed protein product [Orchesella dallaii]|uniref:Uncharacterized protein n=1 Tax=Orchesella dallaii TaxID=48710 RepID=A0ABP1QIL8_9HEXA